ncbi:MAG TPA: trypsin-like peptidase domain-containing protein [Gaiellaceae bacterium]|nr:trypsin-like peptidase domain-containing protein [Gaiellaceae bacterium]
MASRRIVGRAVALAAAGAVGGGLALGGAALAGDLGDETTVQEVQPVAPPAAASQVAAQASARGALSIAAIYRRDAPGVVQVTSTSIVRPPSDPFFGDLLPQQPQTEQSLGSGFVIDKAGHIITNYHVVAGARTVQVSFSDNDRLKARVVGTDPSTDVAVLQVAARSRALQPLPLGNSDLVSVGDPVVAIGNPFGYTRTATSGIVSALQRQITAPNSYPIDHVIQTDAALNHGNSGGPLLNGEGQVIGVNSQISTGNTGGDGNVGIGFAIPVNTVKQVAAQIIRSGKAEHPYLGVTLADVDTQLAHVFNFPVKTGLLVETVQPGGAAARAGLHGGTTSVVVAGESYTIGGDVIVRIDGRRIATVDQLRDVLDTMKPGDRVTLEVYRGRKHLTLTTKLGRQPPTPRS